jgi:hypothetical protein
LLAQQQYFFLYFQEKIDAIHEQVIRGDVKTVSGLVTI